MGLLLYLVGFAVAFASVLGMVTAGDAFLTASNFVDHEGMLGHDAALLALLTAPLVLSAWVGARAHHGWLSVNRGLAAQGGAIAGGISAAIFLSFGAVWAWAPSPFGAAALLVGRPVVLVAPAFVAHLVLRTIRRRRESVHRTAV